MGDGGRRVYVVSVSQIELSFPGLLLLWRGGSNGNNRKKQAETSRNKGVPKNKAKTRGKMKGKGENSVGTTLWEWERAAYTYT